MILYCLHYDHTRSRGKESGCNGLSPLPIISVLIYGLERQLDLPKQFGKSNGKDLRGEAQSATFRQELDIRRPSENWKHRVGSILSFGAYFIISLRTATPPILGPTSGKGVCAASPLLSGSQISI